MEILILAIANRLRDGWITEITAPTSAINKFFTQNSQMGRLLLWGFPMAVAVYLTVQPHWEWYYSLAYFLALVGAGYGGACLAVLGRYDTIPTAWNPWMLTLAAGAAFTMPVALIAALNSYLLAGVLAAAGLFIAPCYWLGWKTPGKWQGTSYGALYFGAVIGVALYLFSWLK